MCVSFWSLAFLHVVTLLARGAGTSHSASLNTCMNFSKTCLFCNKRHPRVDAWTLWTLGMIEEAIRHTESGTLPTASQLAGVVGVRAASPSPRRALPPRLHPPEGPTVAQPLSFLPLSCWVLPLIPGWEGLPGDNMFTLHSESCLRFVFVR